MAIGEAHLGVGKGAPRAGAVEPARFDQRMPDLAAMGAGVHDQGPADRAGHAAQEGQAMTPAFAAALATNWSGAAAPAITRPSSAISTAPKARPPSLMTTPGIPPSRTMRFEPSPIVITGISRGRAAR